MSKEQYEATQKIMDYVEGNSAWRMMVLTGYAGTGKTYTITKLEDWFLYAKKFKVAVSAPTNKAVQVLKDMSEIDDQRLVFSTIHKLLGLKESYDYHGRVSFIPDPANPPSLAAFDVLIVDEASMFDDSLFALINPFVEQGLKIIFVGDPAQIPPVNRIDCIPFLSKKQRQYNIGVCELKEIRRQALDNPLLHLATQIREQRGKDSFDYDYDIKLVNDMGIVPIRREGLDIIYKICDVYFANPIFAAYPDFMKVIAWRNKTVNAVNTRVRQFIYREEYEKGIRDNSKFQLPLLLRGEKLIADEAIKDDRTVIMTTNTEFVVKDYEIKETRYVGKVEDNVVVRNDFKYYDTIVEHMTERGVRQKQIRIIHDDHVALFARTLDEFKFYVQRMSGNAKFGGWREYYKFKNFFAAVKYNYAITAHKSQGSSYENTMMIEWDMYENSRYEERNRIRYVAATRSRKHLFIIK